MTPQRAQELAVELCLAEERPLGPALRALGLPAARQVGTQAEAMPLEEALRPLVPDPRLRALAARVPAVLRAATRRLERLPSPWVLRLPLVHSVLYVAAMAFVQWAMLGLLESKVFPVLAKILADSGKSWALPAPLQDPIGAWALTLLLVVAVLAYLGAPTGLWGWKRALRRAREASVAAALLDAGAPADVLSAYLVSTTSLRDVEPGVSADDLEAIARGSAERAERSLDRVASGLRTAGFVVIGVMAVAILAAVHQAIWLMGAAE